LFYPIPVLMRTNQDRKRIMAVIFILFGEMVFFFRLYLFEGYLEPPPLYRTVR